MHETPPLRVSRPTSACERCRTAKIRCDGKLPACTACEKASRASECSSGTDQFARGKERSYVAALETKIERLERQLYFRRQKGASLVNVGRRPSTREAGFDSKPSKKEETSDILELVSDFGFLAVSATSNGFHGFVKEMSLARLVLSIATVKDLPNAVNYPLPSRNEALDLLQSCIVNFFTLSPVMSSAAAGGVLERVYHHSQMLSSPQDNWNLRLMLALGICARSRANHEDSLKHVAVAIEQYGQVVAPGSLARLEGLLLLVLYSLVNPEALDSWYLMGMASRFTVEMGLHASSGFQNDLKPSQIDHRQKLFQIVYTLDRYVSMTRIRPFSFSDSSADLELPSFITPSDILTTRSQELNAGEDSAKTFAMLSQCQSAWYYALYYSNLETSIEPWITRLSSLQENLGWVSRISDNIDGDLRARFLVQIYYLAVLLVLPMPYTISTSSSYAKAVALEFIVHYVDALEVFTDRSKPLGLSRADDITRSIVVGQRLLALCRDVSSVIYVPPVPNEEELSQANPLPTLKWSDQRHNINEAATAIHRLSNALACLSDRFGRTTSYQDWKLASEDALRQLYGS